MTNCSEAEFLYGSDLSERVRRVCEAEQVDCAVAFLGQGMRADLFKPEQRLRIVCDIAMKSTSRAALKEFGAPNNDDLRLRDWLHSKVYISAAGLIVGSPNMSSNGIGVLIGRPRNLEAGSFHPAGSQAWSTAQNWFETLFNDAPIIGKRELMRAPLYVRDPGPPVDLTELVGLSLLERIKRDPDLFNGVSFIVTSEDLAPRDEKRLIAAEPAGSLSDDDDIEVVVFDPDRPSPDVGKLIIGFHVDDAGARHIDGYITCQQSMRTDQLLVFGRNDWKRLDKRLSQPTLMEACRLSWPLIDKMTDDQVIFTASEFAEALETAKSG